MLLEIGLLKKKKQNKKQKTKQKTKTKTKQNKSQTKKIQNCIKSGLTQFLFLHIRCSIIIIIIK